MLPAISVIITIYQSENTLRKCLDSIHAQTFSNYEILLVDDGSTDGSAKMCDEYANKDSRIKVFHNIHEGVSSARQIGVLNAIGEYSIHCDADDWMEPNMLEVLYYRAKKCDSDVVMSDIIFDYPNKSIYIQQQPSGLDSDSVLSELYYPIYPSLCNKLIRHSLYKQFNIEIKKEVEHAEDLFVMLQLYSHSVKSEYVPSALYHYDKAQNNDSLTHIMDISSIVRSIPYFEELDAKTQPAVNKLKAFVMVYSYNRNIFEYERWKNLYHNVRNIIISEGLKSPIKHWNYIEPGLALYHCRMFGKVYSCLIRCMLALKHRLS